jgi:hypothetical protein
VSLPTLDEWNTVAVLCSIVQVRGYPTDHPQRNAELKAHGKKMGNLALELGANPRFGFLRLVPGDVLRILEDAFILVETSTKHEEWWQEEKAVFNAIKAEITRREKEGEK